jgi:hypothetical protein
MRGYKWARVASAEWVVQSGQGECPMFISPVQGDARQCDVCRVMYMPIAYQLGEVVAHHWHPDRGSSGIYHFNLSDQRPYVDLASSKKDLLTGSSLRYETSWLLDLECAPDCTGKDYVRNKHDEGNQIVMASAVTVKAVYPVCFYCHMEVPIGRMVEGLNRGNTSNTELSAVCEVDIARHGLTAYWIMYNALDGQPWFMPVVDKAEAPSPLSGMVQTVLEADYDPKEINDLKRRGLLPEDWNPGGLVTRFQAKHLGEFRDWDTTVRGDFYRTVEQQQHKSRVIHEITMEQMHTAQAYRKDMREWESRFADVDAKLKAAMEGDVS